MYNFVFKYNNNIQHSPLPTKSLRKVKTKWSANPKWQDPSPLALPRLPSHTEQLSCTGNNQIFIFLNFSSNTEFIWLPIATELTPFTNRLQYHFLKVQSYAAKLSCVYFGHTHVHMNELLYPVLNVLLHHCAVWHSAAAEGGLLLPLLPKLQLPLHCAFVPCSSCVP